MGKQINAQTSTTDTGSGGWKPREAGALTRANPPSELPTVILEEIRRSALKDCPYLKSHRLQSFWGGLAPRDDAIILVSLYLQNQNIIF